MILIPESTLDELTDEEFDQVVLHELAHLHRLDDWTRLFQAVAGCVSVLPSGRMVDCSTDGPGSGGRFVTTWWWALQEEPEVMRPA